MLYFRSNFFTMDLVHQGLQVSVGCAILGFFVSKSQSAAAPPNWGFAPNKTHMEDPDQINMSTVCVCHQQNISVQYTSSYVSLTFCRFTDVESLDAAECNKSSLQVKSTHLKTKPPLLPQGGDMHYKKETWERSFVVLNKNNKASIAMQSRISV